MSKCEHCDKGVPYHYHNFYDGGGRVKFHHGPEYWGYDPDKWETWPCQNQTWFGRHPVYGIMLMGLGIYVAVICIAIGVS